MLTFNSRARYPAGAEHLLRLLEQQYYRKLRQTAEYSEKLQKVGSPLLKLYFESFALDSSKHASLLGSLISIVKMDGLSKLKNLHISIDELTRLREGEKESKNLLLQSLNLTDNDLIRLIIKGLAFDEESHLKLVTDIIVIHAKLSKRKDMNDNHNGGKPLTRCTNCDYELPKNITLNMVPKDIQDRMKDILLTIHCPRCDKPYYSVLNDSDETKSTGTPVEEEPSCYG